MKVYGINLANNARVTNTVIPTGSTFPVSGIGQGTIFYKINGTSEDGLYVNLSNTWKLVSQSGVSNVNNAIMIQVSNPIPNQQLQYDGINWKNEFAPGLKRTIVTTTYYAQLSDTYLGVQHNNSLTIYLPSGVLNKVLIIKDEKGQANSKAINIVSANNETIYYKSSYQMTTKGGCVWLLFGSDNNWNIIN